MVHVILTSTWMKAHHLQLSRSKTELLVFPAKPNIHHSICIQTESLSLAPSKVARNLGVMIDDQLTFKDHVASVARSCRFALLNIRKILPYRTQHATQLKTKEQTHNKHDAHLKVHHLIKRTNAKHSVEP